MLRWSVVWCLLAWPAAWAASVSEVEQHYLALRELRDAIDVTRARGTDSSLAGEPLAALLARYPAQRTQLVQQLAQVDADETTSATDAQALAVMLAALDGGLSPLDTAIDESDAGQAACDYDAAEAARSAGLHGLQQRMYDCFAHAASALPYRDERLDRLGVFARLAVTDDAAQRKALWLALAPVWQAVNADNGADSAYRVMLGLAAAQMAQTGTEPGEAVRGIGVEPAQMAQWLEEILATWRDSLPAGEIEPWDYAYRFGAASRALQAQLPVAALRGINDRFYSDLGANPAGLSVQYDLAPRAGKDPVAFTTFGRRPRLAGDPGEPWVFAAYSSGGLGNLAELLHETGHAVHIAAIRTRPAFADWPDSDIFTEGIADLAALELWTPAWQARYLGQAANAQEGARERLAPVMLDIAWSLFEWRMIQEPTTDPNALWTRLTSDYLRIRPQPEHSWWAVRGQLVDAPGYMLNYAAGAVLVADLRARLAQQPMDNDWYARVAQGLYRFGLEQSSAAVIGDFLGRGVSPQALLDEIRALAQGGSSPPLRGIPLQRVADADGGAGTVVQRRVLREGRRPRSVGHRIELAQGQERLARGIGYAGGLVDGGHYAAFAGIAQAQAVARACEHADLLLGERGQACDHHVGAEAVHRYRVDSLYRE
jgi:hypothetical protein